MRKGNVYYKNWLAGVITETNDGFTFQYSSFYLASIFAQPISFTLPLQSAEYKSKVLFPFFDGLIPEGWLLNIAVVNWKMNVRDRFALLLLLCNDCIGCVSIKDITNEN